MFVISISLFVDFRYVVLLFYVLSVYVLCYVVVMLFVLFHVVTVVACWYVLLLCLCYLG